MLDSDKIKTFLTDLGEFCQVCKHNTARTGVGQCKYERCMFYSSRCWPTEPRTWPNLIKNFLQQQKHN